MLHSLTIMVNFMALVMALWLGLYLVTRNPQRPETWLSALALWSMSGYFLNQLLALFPPPTPPTEIRAWLYHLILFWPRDVFEQGWQGWLQGWLPSYSVIFWFHATLLMLPGRFDRARWVKASVGYAVVFIGILIKVRYASAWVNLAGDPLFTSSLSYPFFPLFAVGFLTIAGFSVLNLARTARLAPDSMPRAQFRVFVCATSLGGATGLLEIASSLLRFPIPQALIALFLSAALLLTGIGVARYNALLDRRPLQQDFLYSAAGAGAVLSIYLLFHRIFSGLYPLPAISYVFIGCLAVISHSLIDVARLQLDRLFFYGKSHQLRLRLRRLHDTTGNRDNHQVLEMALETLSKAISARWAVVLQSSSQGLKLLAAWNWPGELLEGELSSLTFDNPPLEELIVLSPGQIPSPFEQAALMLPLWQQELTGCLLIGPSLHRAGYSQAELETVRDVGDFLADHMQDRNIGGLALTRLEEDSWKALMEGPSLAIEISPRIVEQGLRNLHNYAYLADSPLVELRLVDQRLNSLERGGNTHIDCGNAVSAILIEAIDRLKPDQREPGQSPSRAWYPYLILKEAYLEEQPNLKIMSRLYISEGTFNRTRRSAIHSLARILEEMESGLE